MQVNLTKGVITVGSWTLLSRVLGMVREILLSNLIGAGPLLDAFVAAFRLPNIFRRFFAEGAFNAAFVPLFAKRYESKMEPNEFANNVFANLLVNTFDTHITCNDFYAWISIFNSSRICSR